MYMVRTFYPCVLHVYGYIHIWVYVYVYVYG